MKIPNLHQLKPPYALVVSFSRSAPVALHALIVSLSLSLCLPCTQLKQLKALKHACPLITLSSSACFLARSSLIQKQSQKPNNLPQFQQQKQQQQREKQKQKEEEEEKETIKQNVTLEYSLRGTVSLTCPSAAAAQH